MRQSIGHLAFASWFAMSSAAAESTACSPAIDGELAMTQRNSTSAARLPGLLHPPAGKAARVREAALERVLGGVRAAEGPEAVRIVAVGAEREVALARRTLERLVDLDLVRDARRRPEVEDDVTLAD